ncbi:SDR family NAD(P)-dependent oxidoreductase [Paenibacillus sp. L3-i20]|uniref:SDR family NAD(P)-dependent oxidoreductase n=1 Tax=Paenibacillus sp. L3-i20 TaxID=2905833 RepID=UPI001EE127EC|nr:SDR family NAD(P)-dependent oxidoreductase [Paenibacillus sp. L3-i20]
MKSNKLDISKLRLKSQDELSTVAIKEVTNQDMAIVGIHTNFPMATDTDEFWENIINGISCVTTFPEKRSKDAECFVQFSNKYDQSIPYAKGAFLESIDEFDHSFFNIPPKEALLMNPRQRLFLEAAWSVIEDCGYSPEQISGSHTGVYVGHIGDVEGYLYREMIQEIDPSLLPASMPGNLSSIIASRISYLLNLKGPSMTVDTACSSSLVAVDLACQALRRGECEMAIVGAVRVNLIPHDREFLKLGIESSDDETRAFDGQADGSGMGEGVAAIMLKPLNKAKRDKDHIYCVIKGSATNQDGASMGITAPNPSAQTDVLMKAWKNAGIDPSTLSYIETHGTGTKLGDPIEIEGIVNAFKNFTDKQQFCAIGSVKTNIGHLYDCAGLAGIIKGALALKNKVIPPNLHFNIPNNRIPFIDSPVYVNTAAKQWDNEQSPRRCAVSSFGLSGTNCHVVLEEYDELTENVDLNLNTTVQPALFILSAKSEKSLIQLISRFSEHFAKNKQRSFSDICYTLATGRDHHPVRLVIMANDLEDAIIKIQLLVGKPINSQAYPWLVYSENEEEAADKNSLTEQANKLLVQYQSGMEKSRFELLMQLAALYTAGATIAWNRLFHGSNAKRVSLPSYAFERKRCWITIPDKINKENAALFYKMEWSPEIAEETVLSFQGETILIMGNWVQLVKRLTEAGARCIEVKQAKTYEMLSPMSYTVGESEEDYIKLIEEVKHLEITRVLHMFALNQSSAITTVGELEYNQNFGVYSLFNLTKAIIKSRIGHKVDMLIVADCVNQVSGTERCIKPENATIFGVGKVIGIEYPNLLCRAIDLDEFATENDVIAEMKKKKDTYQIAFRNGIRYVEHMKEAFIKPEANSQLVVKDKGVYIITGGAGNLGLLMAKHLASKGNVNLALINRTPVPEQSEWADVLSNNDGSALYTKIKALQDIIQMGAHVECITIDVTSLDSMSDITDKLRQKFGKINGVIHAAGVAGKGFLVRKETNQFHNVLSPKVMGTWILDQVTKEDHLDFFVLFSSGVALSGEMGQGDYTAANCYLDSFASYRRMMGKHALSINWVVWEGARMAEGKSSAIDGVFKVLPHSQALHAFDRVIANDDSRILIGELNTESHDSLELFSKDAAFRLPEKMAYIIKNNLMQRERNSYSQNAARNDTEVKLVGSNKGSYSEIEKKLAHLYREVLGYEELSIHDSFFELGGDSVQLHRLHKLVDTQFPKKSSIADLFAYSSISKLAGFLNRQDEGGASKKKEVGQRHLKENWDDDIAIIGMSAQFPGASSIEEYWINVQNAVDCMQPIPSERRAFMDEHLAYTGQAATSETKYMEIGYLENIDHFDYRFFKISPKEANLTDPCQRLFMQSAWNAIEDAGYGGDKLRGSRTGIYVGFANVIRDSYQKLLTDIDPVLMSESIVGNVSAMMPSRISHLLDLKGPTMVVDTACSSSLIAVHTASNAIRNGDCDAAIVGGMKLFLIPVDHEHNKIGIESKDGKTRAFDAYSDGSGVGEGSGVIFIKSLRKAKADQDRIYAVIKGSAINHDGTSIGITAPNPQAQTDVILHAWEKAGIHPESIAFIETHGTGTELGDPIEISGLTHAMEAYTDKKQFCAIGSVKSNIGHLNEAAGMASIIKTVLSVKNRVIPPTMYFQTPNPKIDFYDSPLFINTHLKKWEVADQPMRGAISSFGLSGTNCHMIIEEYNEFEAESVAYSDDSQVHIFTLSAISMASLQRLLHRYAELLTSDYAEKLADICYTANTGRGHYNCRIAFIVKDISELKGKISLVLESSNYKELSSDGIYYSYHRAVSDQRLVKNEGDLTESEKNSLNEAAHAAVRSCSNSKIPDFYMEKIINLYIDGADIDWELLYEANHYMKVHLPVYPFEPTKCWVDIPKRAVELSSTTRPATFTMSWKRQDRLEQNFNSNQHGITVVLLEKHSWSGQLVEILKQSGKQVLEIVIPELAVKEDAAVEERRVLHYFSECLCSIREKRVAQIIHCGTLKQSDVTAIEHLEASQSRGVISLFLFMKAYMECGFEGGTEVILLSENVNRVTGDEQVLRPEHATLFGLGKILPKEYANVRCRIIDMDEGMKLDELVKELHVNDYTQAVAYRNGQRFVEIFDEYSELYQADAATSGDAFSVTNDGVYIITGGTGGIGLEMAKLLASKGKIKLVLVNRSAMADRISWDTILDQASDRQLCEKIIDIKQMEEKGCSVICYQADVSKADQTAAMLEEIRSRYGAIKGIVHGAGIATTESIAEKSLNTFIEGFRAKVYGTWLLNELTAEDNLEFFLMFSSVATMFGTAFQSDYVAANCYLDAYSDLRSKDGRKQLTINWTTWRDKGMASNHNFQVDTIFKSIAPSYAMEVLEQSWGTSLTRVLIGELNLESKMVHWLNNYGIQLSDKVKARLESVQKPLKYMKQAKPSFDVDSEVKLIGSEFSDYRETEQEIAQVCREVLGFDEIDIHENFFEMGADSLIIKQIDQQLKKRHRWEVTVTDLFEYPTVYKLSRFIQQKRDGNQGVVKVGAAQLTNQEISLDEKLNRIFNELDEGTLSIDQVLQNLGNSKEG